MGGRSHSAILSQQVKYAQMWKCAIFCKKVLHAFGTVAYNTANDEINQ